MQNFEDEINNELENAIINNLCPNPDQMTYEELLEFQEKIGFEDKGFSDKEIQVIKFNLIYFIFLENPFN